MIPSVSGNYWVNYVYSLWEGLRYHTKVVIVVMQSLYYIIILMCNPGQFMQDVFVIIGRAFRCAIKPG